MYSRDHVVSISIHAPREGGDVLEMCPIRLKMVDFNPRPPRGGRPAAILAIYSPRVAISIHAPREGGDIIPCFLNGAKLSFQSTPPARGATLMMEV